MAHSVAKQKQQLSQQVPSHTDSPATDDAQGSHTLSIEPHVLGIALSQQQLTACTPSHTPQPPHNELSGVELWGSAANVLHGMAPHTTLLPTLHYQWMVTIARSVRSL